MKYFCTVCLLLFFPVLLSVTTGCKSVSHARDDDEDSTLLDPVSVNNLFLDSLTIDTFLSQHPQFKEQSPQVRKFYKKRGYQFAWFNNEGLVEQAANFMNMLIHYRDEGLSDSTIYNRELKQLYDTLSSESYRVEGKDSIITRTELLLSSEFFKYAQLIWGGMDEKDLKNLDWYIKRKRLPYVSMLDSMLANPTYFTSQKAVYRQYGLLKEQLKQYRDIEKTASWPQITADAKSYKPGDSSQVIPAIMKKLFTLGDLTRADTSAMVFDSTMVKAVKNFQQRFGLTVDGIIGADMISELNVPLSYRIQEIMINMERSRWVPAEIGGDYLAVNIPEYMLHVYEGDSLKWECNVVVGSVANQTVIFNDKMKYIVFSPYWNIPPSIVAKEILPAAKRNPSYLSKKNMEVVSSSGVVSPSSIDWERYSGYKFPYTIRQKPGPNNSLGRVKFIFPNNYNIYLHDTPSKSLFEESSRAFSHGCIRVGEPLRLAEYLLRNDSTWTHDKIVQAMNSGKETTVTLQKTVPVFIAYFTAWVDRKGRINFRKDIYGHDARMAKVMFSNPSL